MDGPQQPAQQTGPGAPKSRVESIMRKIELFFLSAFFVLAVAYLIVPHASGLKIAPFYVAAVVAVLYAICSYFLRFKLYVHFGLMLHLGIFLLLSSTACFEIRDYRTGTAMIVIGILSVAFILVFATLGKPVITRQQDRARRQQGVPVNQPGDEIEEDELDPDFLHQPMDLDQGVPNGHAVHMRDFPLVRNPVIEQEENPDEQAVQREDPDEQIIQGDDQAVQREDPDEQDIQREEQVVQREEEPADDRRQNLDE